MAKYNVEVVGYQSIKQKFFETVEAEDEDEADAIAHSNINERNDASGISMELETIEIKEQ